MTRFLVLILFQQLFLQSTSTTWKYAIYFQDDCSGVSETFTSSVPQLPYPELIRSRSIYGLWAEYTAPAYATFYNNALQKPILQQSFLTPICISSNSFGKVKSIRKIGSIPNGISFFRERNLGGTELYFSGYSLSLPTRQFFSSFAHAGNQSWKVWNEPDWSGRDRCLNISSYAVGYKLDESLEIGSFHITCGVGSKDIAATPAITFYTWDNRYELFFRGTELKLPYALKFQSFSLHGRNEWNWTVLTKSEDSSSSATIQSVCLPSIGIEENVIIPQESEFSIIGIKLGCLLDQYPNPTTVAIESSQNSGLRRQLESIAIVTFVIFPQILYLYIYVG